MYDYCLVESKRANMSWDAALEHLSRHCGGTEKTSLGNLRRRSD